MTYRLSITTWAARSRGTGGAEHYYGRVRFDGNEIDLEHEVFIKDPLYHDNSLRCAQAGPEDKMTTSRFAVLNELIAAFRKFLWSEAKPFDTIETRIDGKEVKL